jgi:hypothetical protein
VKNYIPMGAVSALSHAIKGNEGTFEEFGLSHLVAHTPVEPTVLTGYLKAAVEAFRVALPTATAAATDGATGGAADRLRDVCSWKSETDEDMVRILAEVLLSADLAIPMLESLRSSNEEWESGELLLEYLLACLMAPNPHMRHWSIKALWCTLKAYSQLGDGSGAAASRKGSVEAANGAARRGLLAQQIDEEGGFLGLASQHLLYVASPDDENADVPPVAEVLPLDAPGCTALIEIATSSILKPSDGVDGDHVLETFGKSIDTAEGADVALQLLLNWLAAAGKDLTMELRRRVLKDLFVLIMRSKPNCQVLAKLEHWQRCLLPALELLPGTAAQRDEAQDEVYKYTVNICTFVHGMQFGQSRATFATGLNCTMLALYEDYGWAYDAVTVARNVLVSLVGRVQKSARLWKTQLDATEWESVWELVAIVEDFMFSRLAKVHEVEQDYLLTRRNDHIAANPHKSSRGSVRVKFEPLGEKSKGLALGSLAKRDTRKDEVGVHINPTQLTCDDTMLAQAVVSLLMALGFKPVSTEAAATAQAEVASKKERDQLKRGHEAANAFNDYVSLFTSIDHSISSREEGKDEEDVQQEQLQAVLEKVSSFLEKRQRKGIGFGFFSKAKKKNIAQSLQKNVTRQRAKRLIQAAAEKKNQEQAAIASADALADAASGGDQKAEELSLEALAASSFTCRACMKEVTEKDEGAVNALGRAWHKDCFTCFECKCPLHDSEFFSPGGGDAGPVRADTLFDWPYCADHYEAHCLPRCAGKDCGTPITLDGLQACGKCWHSEHFGCVVCSKSFEGGSFFEHDGQPYCDEHYYECHGERCHGCSEVIKEGSIFNALDHAWHPEHFVCVVCTTPFKDMEFYSHQGQAYCEEHYCENVLPKCAACGERVDFDYIEVGHAAVASAVAVAVVPVRAYGLLVRVCSPRTILALCANVRPAILASHTRWSQSLSTRAACAALTMAARRPSALPVASPRR